jgi:hypothetical protein
MNEIINRVLDFYLLHSTFYQTFINQNPMTMLAPIIVFIMLILIIDLGRFRMNKGRKGRPVEKK